MQIVDFFYTKGQVAKAMGVNRITIQRWIKDGKFNIQRVGGVVLIPKWEVELLKTKTKEQIKIGKYTIGARRFDKP